MGLGSRFLAAMILSEKVTTILLPVFDDFLTVTDYDGPNEKIPDDDPLDSLGHGTHVAGIIAGKSEL